MLKVVGLDYSFDYYLNDPTTPSLIIKVPLPKISDSPLELEVIGFREGPLVQADSVRIQAASVLYSILFTLDWVNKIRPIEKWAATRTLKVSPRAGKQFNAYYDRFGIHFFYEIHPFTKKMIFISDSTEAVNHEFGHAILDSFRPDFWDLSNLETFCFHEAYGDIISMLSSLQHSMIVEHMIQETNGDLSKSNVVSRIVDELGNALHHRDLKGGRPPNCLRDVSEPFIYVSPNQLPSNCPFNILGREAHNFSRVFSSAWYKIFTEICNLYNKDKVDSIFNARDIMARLSISFPQKMEKRKDMYCAAAQSIIQSDKDYFGGEHVDLIRRVFRERNILSCLFV